MGVFKEFREFIARGNVVDLAVGVIIGAAFGKIVTSLVDQVVMPPIGLALGGLDFAKLEWVLKPEDPATEAVEKVAIQYGAFFNTLIQFLITAFAIFLLVKLVNAARRKQEEAPAAEAPAAPTPTETLLVEIRDLLKVRPTPAPAPAAARAAPVVVAAPVARPVTKPAPNAAVAKPAAKVSPPKAAAKPAPKVAAKPAAKPAAKKAPARKPPTAKPK